MIIVCQKCASRLQVDETKVASKPFTIRCPKCNANVEAGSTNSVVEQGAAALGNSPATGNPRRDQPKPAPLYQLDQTPNEAGATASTDKLAELLSALVSQPAAIATHTPTARPSWNPRKVLVCIPEENRELVARSLAEAGYQTFVAEDTRQAVERMRENQLDVVVLDSKFDPVEQGNVFVTREVNILRPAQRRRLFFVLVSASLRTMDSHAAFLHNVNAVINVKEVEELPALLEHRLRDYNELYKEFNGVLMLPAL